MNDMNNKPEFRFMGKYIITADLTLKTGLHIGGTDEGFDIGGIDNPVWPIDLADPHFLPSAHPSLWCSL